MYQFSSGPHNASRRLDLIHIILGVVIVVMAVLAFTDPEENMVLFPLIFFCAALLRIIHALFLIHGSGYGHKCSTQGMVQLIIGAGILLLGIVSAVSIW